MRYTVVDATTTVSFIGPDSALQGLVAACTANPATFDELLERASRYTGDLRDRVVSGLATFDEHNTRTNPRWIHAALDVCSRDQLPVFRVLDPRTREASLSPAWGGVVVFNLRSRRIVQIHNTYREVSRKGRIRARDAETSKVRVERYELPPEWTVVPER
jgi:hypothetical protein